MLADDSPPCLMVVRFRDNEQLTAQEGLLGLPSAEEPLATIYRGSATEWILEHVDGTIVRLEHSCVFRVNTEHYRFCCPDGAEKTQTVRMAATESNVGLLFRVSRDEEHVELELKIGERRVMLGTRLHNYLLLTLARAWLRDSAQQLPASSCGWVYKEDLMPEAEPQRVDNEVFRLRRHVAEREPLLAGRLIERRPRTRQLRIGITAVKIEVV